MCYYITEWYVYEQQGYNVGGELPGFVNGGNEGGIVDDGEHEDHDPGHHL